MAKELNLNQPQSTKIEELVYRWIHPDNDDASHTQECSDNKIYCGTIITRSSNSF